MKDIDNTNEYAGQRRIAKGMIVAAWVGLLLILTLFFSSYLERRNNPNSNPETSITGSVKEVLLQRNRAGHYVTSGAINGKVVIFLLDTGATDVAVSGELANALGLRRGMPMSSQTANGMVTAWQTELAEVSIGAIRLHNVRASILPSLDGDEVLLGMSFLQQLELVQRGKHLLLRQN